jgi:hypothetical protein
MLLSEALLFEYSAGIPWPNDPFVTVMTSPNSGWRFIGALGEVCFCGGGGFGFDRTFRLDFGGCTGGGSLAFVFVAAIGVAACCVESPLNLAVELVDVDDVRERGCLWEAECPAAEDIADACSIWRMRSLMEPPDAALGIVADAERAFSPTGIEADRGLMGGGPDKPFSTGFGPLPLTVRGIRLCVAVVV